MEAVTSHIGKDSKKYFSRVFDENSKALFLLASKDGKARALLDHMTANMNGANWFSQSREGLKEEFGWSLPTLSAKFNKLVKEDYIREARSGTSKFYMVNPNIYFRGTEEERGRALVDYQGMRYKKAANGKEYANIIASVRISRSEQ